MVDKELHYKLAKLSTIAYDQHTYSSGDVEVFHEIKGGIHFFAIRGTEAADFFSGRGFIDVIRDLRVWPRKIGNTKAHAGFVKGYKEIEQYILTILAKDKRPIVLTGHSMGGAIALIAGYSIQKSMGGRLLDVVTFGAPRCIRVGTIEADILEELKAKTTQYQHVQDKVPGFLSYTYYEHVDNSFLPYRFKNGPRANWLSRGYKFHPMKVYLTILAQMSITA